MFSFFRDDVARALLDALEDAVLLFEAGWRPVYRNSAAEALEARLPPGAFRRQLQQRLTELRKSIPEWAYQRMHPEESRSIAIDDAEWNLELVDGTSYRFFLAIRRVVIRQSDLIAVFIRTLPSSRKLRAQRDQALIEAEKSANEAQRVHDDLTHQKEDLEEALHNLAEEMARRRTTEDARDQYAAIVHSSDDAIYSCNLQGIVTAWNQAAERLFDYTSGEISGTDSKVLVPEEERASMRELLRRLSGGERIQSFECVRLTRRGKRVHVATTWSPLYDSRGRMTGYSIIARDITRRVEAERELARYREHLERLVSERTQELLSTQERIRQTERLASIGALAAGIAHEINNPIGAMLLAAQNALEASAEGADRASLQKELDRLGKKVITNAQRCGVIVRGVLQFARKHQSEKSPQDLNVLVHTSVELIRDSMHLESASIETILAPGLPLLHVNPVEVEQVIVNVVKNACESTKGEVRVTVRTLAHADGVRLIVSDNGRGIAEDQLRHIFDPFYTTRQVRGGTGLGLSIVHGIVTSYGGSIDVSSAPEQGTTVTIDLPASGNGAFGSATIAR